MNNNTSTNNVLKNKLRLNIFFASDCWVIDRNTPNSINNGLDMNIPEI